VAIQALQFCVAKGANVYVTSSQQDKIDRAISLGAKAGLNYKEDDWAKKLAGLLPKERPTLDAVIDSAGGNITTQLLRVLRHGARVAVYGQ
jgi:NADPH:quinone reductase-like Zn-dependent oxidoreductase